MLLHNASSRTQHLSMSCDFAKIITFFRFRFWKSRQEKYFNLNINVISLNTNVKIVPIATKNRNKGWKGKMDSGKPTAGWKEKMDYGIKFEKGRWTPNFRGSKRVKKLEILEVFEYLYLYLVKSVFNQCIVNILGYI